MLIDLDAMPRIERVARASGLESARVGGGLIDLWEWCWLQKTDTVDETKMSGFFGPEFPRMRDALVAFGFLTPAGDGYFRVWTMRVVGAVRQAEDRNPVVYFVRAGDGAIKIGFTERIKRRLATLQTAHGEHLHLLLTIPGSPEKEAELHLRFAKLRLKGEWFRAEHELLTFINSGGKG